MPTIDFIASLNATYLLSIRELQEAEDYSHAAAAKYNQASTLVQAAVRRHVEARVALELATREAAKVSQ